jgi:hypothetical protein
MLMLFTLKGPLEKLIWLCRWHGSSNVQIRKTSKIVYNGHKRVHSIKFQSVVIPNGLIANLAGPRGKFFKIIYH